MFDGGSQFTPALDVSAVQEPIGPPTYSDFSSGFEFDGPETANWNPGSVAQVYANATQTLDVAPGPLISQHDIAQGYLNNPRIILEKTEGRPTVLEGDCHLEDPIAHGSEVTSQITAGAGIQSIHDIGWAQGGTINPQLPCIGSGLKPHARPSELGDEYVSIRLDDVGNANSNLSSDRQAMDVETPAAYNTKPSAHIGNDGKNLVPKKGRIERRRSVPHRRLRKRSSLDQGAKHPQCIGTRTQIVGTQVFDANMKIKPSRTRRRFSEGEKERIALVRKAGACRECRRMKRKVHIHKDFSQSIGRLTCGRSAIMLWQRPQQRHQVTTIPDP